MRHSSIIFASLILILSVTIISCKNQQAIEEKKFVKIYTDMIFMQDTSSLSQLKIKKEILMRFNVSEKDYNNTIQFYNDDPERWQPFFDSVITYIEKMKPKPKKIDVRSLPEQSLSLDKKDF